MKKTIQMHCHRCGKIEEILQSSKNESGAPGWFYDPREKHFNPTNKSYLCLACYGNEFVEKLYRTI